MARIGLGEPAAALQSLAVKRESRLRTEAVRGPERNSLRGYSEFKKIVL